MQAIQSAGKLFSEILGEKIRPRGSELDRFFHSSRGSAFNTKALLQKTRTCAIMKKDL